MIYRQQRIRMNEKSAWPERVGAYGWIVVSNESGYPWTTKGRNEVVVELDDDPLDTHTWEHGWTCVTDRQSVDDYIEEETAVPQSIRPPEPGESERIATLYLPMNTDQFVLILNSIERAFPGAKLVTDGDPTTVHVVRRPVTVTK